MLLTGSQISVAISSGVVCIFTTLLFLSGYVLQQRTIRSLQAAIQPKAPARPVQTLNPILAKHFGRPPGHSFYDKYLASNRPKGGWAKVAYVQLLRSHAHVCNAVMAFAALEGQESMAQRVLMYPSDWDEGDEFDGDKAITQGLLRKAASRYKVMLQPISPSRVPAHGDESEQATFSDEEQYPLTNLLSLLHHNRLLYLQPSGLILSSSPLDLLFTYPIPEAKHMLGFTSPIPSSADRPAVLLIEPTRALQKDTMAALPEGTFLDTEFLSLVTSRPAPPATPAENTKPAMLLAETSSLHNVDAGFNATEFLDTTGYVHIQDDGALGPEFAANKAFGKAAPPRKEARKAWEGVYQRFREGRVEICGLDLEVAVEPDQPSAVEVKDEPEEPVEPSLVPAGHLDPTDEEDIADDAVVASETEPEAVDAEDLGLEAPANALAPMQQGDPEDEPDPEATDSTPDLSEQEKPDLRR